MTDSIVLQVHGEPMGAPRPRGYARMMRGRAVARIFVPKTDESWRQAIAAACLLKRPSDPWSGPISVSIEAIFPPLKSDVGRWWHTSKPDSDNVGKGALDALVKSRMFHDDTQVAILHISKRHARAGERPGAVIEITRLETITQAPKRLARNDA